jgi:Glycine-zipper domain
MRMIMLTAAAAISFAVAACGNTTASRSLSGSAMGAAGGAALGAIGGNAALGAVAGAGAGLVGGYLYDQHKKGNIDF